MIKLSAIILLVSVIYYTLCLPTISNSKTHSESRQKLNLYVNNGSQVMDHHLASVIADMETVGQKIYADHKAIMPLLNFLFDDAGDWDGTESCMDQMEIQLVEDI